MEQPDDLPVWLLGGQIALSDPQFLGFAREWTAEAIKQFPQDQMVGLHRAEVLLLSGQAEEALRLWRRAGAPQNAVYRAARALCELVVGERVNAVSPNIESAVSGEFIKWYQRLLGTGQTAVVEVVNERLDSLARALPSAARTVESAIAQVQSAAIC
jgi:hypothetical protein